jgi:CarD family transcriptional regulator
VLKSLTFLAKSKSLSFREKRMLDRAQFLIISEVSEVMRLTAADIEGRVRPRTRAAASQPQGSGPSAVAPRAKVAKAAPRAVAASAPARSRRAGVVRSHYVESRKSKARRTNRSTGFFAFLIPARLL